MEATRFSDRWKSTGTMPACA